MLGEKIILDAVIFGGCLVINILKKKGVLFGAPVVAYPHGRQHAHVRISASLG